MKIELLILIVLVIILIIVVICSFFKSDCNNGFYRRRNRKQFSRDFDDEVEVEVEELNVNKKSKGKKNVALVKFNNDVVENTPVEQSTSVPTLVLLYSPSCPHCVNFMPEFNKLPSLAGGFYEVAMVNVNDPNNDEKAASMCSTVQGVPTIRLYVNLSDNVDNYFEYKGKRLAHEINKFVRGYIEQPFAF